MSGGYDGLASARRRRLADARTWAGYCAVCGHVLAWCEDQWHCAGCGAEFHAETIAARRTTESEALS